MVQKLNLITAFSNISVLYPLYISNEAGDTITTNLLWLMFFASAISHLIENHKHGMGTKIIPEWVSLAANKIDVLMCIVLVINYSILFCVHYQFDNTFSLVKPFVARPFKIALLVLLPHIYLMNRISESEKTIKTRKRYVILHSLWHFFIFIWLGLFYREFFLPCESNVCLF